jgi:hypothetical protein
VNGPGPLEDHASEFTSRNQFLFALLGLVGATRKLDRLIESHASHAGGQRLEAQPHFLLMVLGAVRLGQTVRDHVFAWATETPRVRPVSPEREPWLRDMLL